MRVGSAVVAPEGYLCLEGGRSYHLVRNHRPSGRVVFAFFIAALSRM